MGDMDLKRTLSLLLILLLSFSLISCSPLDSILEEDESSSIDVVEENENLVDKEVIEENGYYTSKEDVSLYIHTYGKLPGNFISRKEAIKLGWDSKKGNLWDVTDKMSIGGDKFGNREGKLPISEGRQYYECDINYEGGYRGPERIVYSNDGLVYYTGDHYESFILLYGDE